MNESNDSQSLSAKEIFFAALDQPNADARAAFLDGACGRNPVLRQQVDKLLADHFEEDSFLQTSAVDGAPTLVDETPVTEGPGAQIDRYKLLQKLGEGGFGVVYMAEQKEPVKRRIALKIIKLGMDTKQVVARFEAERQALAMMDHPNIAKVLDAGATETGRPYFVMELVKGVAITKYCDDNNLTTKERLDLFIPVCQAIQHAHQKGIIHRDIKPSNVMVTLHDGLPVPKVIDFGIAKATQQELTEKTIFTQYSQFIGTPAYMSPEQAEMSGLDIDTRSDIYSLGVLLYELLVGKTPLDGKELMSGGYDEIRRRIKEEEPAKPSTRVNTMEGSEKTTVAKHRKIGPDQLSSELRGDLDWIVLKALEKDRTRRYETANGFVLDIKRFLSDEPVAAVPPSKGYLLKKYVRRHKTSLAVAATIVGLLIAGVATSTWQAVRATQAQRAAEDARVGELQEKEEAQRQRGLAQEKQREAEQSRSIAEQERRVAESLKDQFRVQAYQADMNLASQAYQAGDIDRMNELVETHWTEPGERDLRGFEWYHWWHAGRLQIGQYVPGGSLQGIQTSPTAPISAIAYRKDMITVGGSPSGRTDIKTIDTELAPYLFTPDGTSIVIGESLSGRIRVHDVASKSNRTYPAPKNHDIRCLAFSPSGELMATGGRGRDIVLWNTDTWEPVGKKMQSSSQVCGLAFGDDGKTLISAMENSSVVVWDVEDVSNPLERRTLAGHGRRVSCVVTSPIADFFVTGSVDETVRLWDGNLELIGTYDATGPVNILKFSPDGKSILAGTAGNNSVLVWDVRTDPLSLKRTHNIKGHYRKITGGFIIPEQNHVHSVSVDGFYRVWDLDHCEPYTILDSIPSARRIGFADDGKTLLVLDQPGSGHQWNLDSRQMLEPVTHQNRFHVLALSAGGAVHAGVTQDGFVAIKNTANNRFQKCSMAIKESDEHFMVLSGDGSTVAWMTEEGVNIWNSKNNREMIVDVGSGHLPGYVRELHLPTLSFNGEMLVVTGTEINFSSELWDISNKRPSRVWPNPLKGNGPERYATFSNDGKLLAIGSWNTDVRVHQTESGKLLKRLKSHSEPVGPLAFSSDGTRLISIGEDHKACIWDVETGGLLTTLQGHENRATSVVWSPENDSIAALSVDGTVKIWTSASSQQVADKELAHLKNRASHHARAGNWSKATTYHRQITEQNPDDELNWMKFAASLVAVRATNEYQILSKDMLEHFSDTGAPEIADRIVKASVILPPAEAQLQEITRLAEFAVSDPDHWSMPYARMTRGLVDYRNGDFQGASEWSVEALQSTPAWFIQAQSNLVLAMSEQQLGHTDDAQFTLKQAKKVMNTASPNFNAGWHDWFFSQALLHEADQLINGAN